jgi:hypothetical protein
LILGHECNADPSSPSELTKCDFKMWTYGMRGMFGTRVGCPQEQWDHMALTTNRAAGAPGRETTTTPKDDICIDTRELGGRVLICSPKNQDGYDALQKTLSLPSEQPDSSQRPTETPDIRTIASVRA